MNNKPISDHDVLTAMLDRAGIPHKQREDGDSHGFGVPSDSSSLYVGHWTGPYLDDGSHQPYDGGYSGFFTEFVFSAEGSLMAVWAWE